MTIQIPIEAPLTDTVAGYIAGFRADDLPAAVLERTLVMVRDGSGALLAATDPRISTGRLIADFARRHSGREEASLVGQGVRADMVNAALVNGTLGYACDIEPHHPEGVLHPIAVMLPTALAVAESVGADGGRFLAAIALGCEIEYRVSVALGPVEQYDLGFHPSAVCGCFGATAAAAFLLGLDHEQVVNAMGLAACQASGMMAWESDPTENSRPFQMGMAARNGLTAALLAGGGFGGPRAIFDSGHTIFGAFSRNPDPRRLTAGLGERFDGIMELAVKPYSCVSFLHPGLDGLLGLAQQHGFGVGEVEAMTIRFPASGAHCIDGNPLKSHCAQYVLPVALSSEGLRVIDIFEDRRLVDPEVARLSRNVGVVRDAELDRGFPESYDTVVEVRMRDGRRFEARNSIARGYPEAPLSEDELVAKFRRLAGAVAGPDRIASLEAAIGALPGSPSVSEYARLMRAGPDGERAPG